MTDKLKSCPFCDGDPMRADMNYGFPCLCVRCTKCTAQTTGYALQSAADTAWNSRHYLQELKACNDEYEALETENNEMQTEIERLQSAVSDIELSAISLVTSEHLRLTDSTAWLNIGMKNIQSIVEFSLHAFLKARMKSW